VASKLLRNFSLGHISLKVSERRNSHHSLLSDFFDTSDFNFDSVSYYNLYV